MSLTSKKAPATIRKVMVSMEEATIKAKELKDDYERNKQIVSDCMLENNVNEFIYDDGKPQVLSALKYNQMKITYDITKLKKRLDKKVYNNIVDKMFVIEESGLRKFLEKHPDLKSELQQFISRHDTLNEQKLDILFEKQIINLDNISGCYSVKTTNAFKLQRKKREE